MAEVEEEAPSKGGLIKIILIVLVVLLVGVGSALGALFFTGFFDEKEADAAEEAIAELEAEIEGTDAIQTPEKVAKEPKKKRSSSQLTTPLTNPSLPMWLAPEK